MNCQFSFYKKEDLQEITEMILRSYSWERPFFGLSRLEFANGLHPAMLGFPDAWERTTGVWRSGGEIAACAISEGNDEGQAFFLFKSQELAVDKELLQEMLFHAKTTLSTVDYSRQERRYVSVLIPQWNRTLAELAEQNGFQRQEDGQERVRIRSFAGAPFPVRLPEGYTIADGHTVPPFYQANVHMAAFHYSIKQVPDCARGFAELRKQQHYDPDLDLCILDPQGRPVAMANTWCAEGMPYCELEPLGVAFWERRKGLGTAILNESANRVLKKYPNCTGMSGGDQPFYDALGFEVAELIPAYQWEKDLYISWDPRSADYRGAL